MCCDVIIQLESAEVDCQMSEQSGATKSFCENGGSVLNGRNKDLTKDHSDPNASIVDDAPIPDGTSNGRKEDPVKDQSDLDTGTVDDAPIPGTSKSSGVRKGSSKEPKRSSPDTVEGRFVMF